MSRVANIAKRILDFRSNSRKDADELEKIQLERLNGLLAYASENVPAYKRLSGARIRSMDELGAIPTLTKAAVQGATESFISRRFRCENLIRIFTSGSTGMPLRLYFDADERDYFIALRYFGYLESGLRPFDIQAHLTYAAYPPHPLEALGMFRCRYVDMRLKPAAALEALRKSGAAALFSNPTLFHPLSLENDREGRETRFRLLFSFAEPLDSEIRESAMRSFGCRVFERYGAAETSVIAMECPGGNLHVQSDSIIVEILDQDGNPVKRGEPGSVFLTPLWRRCMPFIRYRIGDVAAFGGRCPCGRASKTLAYVKGRENGYIRLPSGRAYWGTNSNVHLRRIRGISQFQIVQERSGEITVRLVPTDRSSPPPENEVVSALLSTLPEKLPVSVELTDHIPRNKHGKLAHFVSKMVRM
ncbi:AMP-binding protein [Candidatus Micrarchaeota archaeon]|nr:AMP-binding protein [Candidatus Micrarchaeota archaeon]